MFSLIILFFFLPLYFSHIFLPFGLGGVSLDYSSFPFGFAIGDSYSFERQKVYLFLILIVVAIIESVFRSPIAIGSTLRKYSSIILVAIFLPFFGVFFGLNQLDIFFFFGGHEKHHGYIFYIGILCLVVLLASSSKIHLEKYLRWSMLSAVIVAIIGIGEHFGGIYDIYGRSEMISLYSGRSSSTLGNPNYVAGYLLLFIPIFINHISIKRVMDLFYLIGLILIIFGIYVTESYIAIALICLLFLWYNVVYVFSRYTFKLKIALFIVMSFVMLGLGYMFLSPDKLLSLLSRFILMKELLFAMLHQPISVLLGFGPDTILQYFSFYRSLEIDSYFPQSMLIDSSHNMLIDILFQYGILMVVYPVYILYIYRHQLYRSAALSFLLFITFFSLNVIIIVPLAVSILLYFIMIHQNIKNPD